MKLRVTITVDESLLNGVTALVDGGIYDSRSAAFEDALRALQERGRLRQFEANLRRLDPTEERRWAEWGNTPAPDSDAA